MTTREPGAPTKPRTGGRRVAAIVAVVVVAVAGGLAGGIAARRAPAVALQSAGLAAEAAPTAAQSSSWYCAGGSGAAGSTATSRVLLVNAGSHAVSSTVRVVSTTGTSGQAHVTVPAHGEVTETPAKLADKGSWLGAVVDVAGGAITASEEVSGSDGWAVAPCASETAPTWYFAAGATTAGNTLRLSVLNPTANLAVVDLSFLTAAGTTAPQPYQGLVIEPGALRSVTVGKYVQDQKQVAAVVSARSGAVVATELQTSSVAGVSGLALRLGSPTVSTGWDLPRAEDVSGGTSALAVFNPTNRVQHVSVTIELASGPAAPFRQTVPADSVWSLDTADEVRIPDGVEYAATVQSSGGSGVVVDRTTAGTSGTSAPSWGDDAAVSGASSVVTQWVVPAVDGSSGSPAPTSLVLQNAGHRRVVAVVSALDATGVHRVDRVTVAAGSVTDVAAGTEPVLVTADGPLAVVGDASPPGAPATGLVPSVPLG